MVLVIIKFLVLYSQKDLTLYVDKNGTVEDLLQEAANEVYVTTLKCLDSSVQVEGSMKFNDACNHQWNKQLPAL